METETVPFPWDPKQNVSGHRHPGFMQARPAAGKRPKGDSDSPSMRTGSTVKRWGVCGDVQQNCSDSLGTLHSLDLVL
ncbi:hypothetical protein GF1_04600 [Desulfolithobacter dissulfuricans]|uniref:Uncharacterized protein n=1 Tax=Desulfolithobacter dissulfuricans TaxID=2795293 RepID=A0A915TYF2_9BACT|nr:hypothetical protein GF1_04600 [Desulfolithobacter dissulfuricans]